MKRIAHTTAVLLGAGSLVLAASWAAAQAPGGNTPRQDRTRTELRQHQPGTGSPANQVKKQLRSRSKDGGQAGATEIGAGAAGQGTGGGQGKKYGPGDGSGNQGMGPRDGSGYGPGDCTQPGSGTGSQRRVGRAVKGRG